MKRRLIATPAGRIQKSASPIPTLLQPLAPRQSRLDRGLIPITFLVIAAAILWLMLPCRAAEAPSSEVSALRKELEQLKEGQRILCGVPESGRFSYYFMQLTAVRA